MAEVSGPTVTMQVTLEEFDFVTKILAVFKPEMATRICDAREKGEPFPGAYQTVDKLLDNDLLSRGSEARRKRAHGEGDPTRASHITVRVANAMHLFSKSLAERRRTGSSLADFWDGLPIPKYVVDLVQWSRRDLEAIPNMGRKSVDYLEKLFNEAGFKLREGGR